MMPLYRTVSRMHLIDVGDTDTDFSTEVIHLAVMWRQQENNHMCDRKQEAPSLMEIQMEDILRETQNYSKTEKAGKNQ